jgi:hypothetical protein
MRREVQPFAISRVGRREIFAPNLAKPPAPFIQPDLETFVRKRLLDDDVGSTVAVYVHSR